MCHLPVYSVSFSFPEIPFYLTRWTAGTCGCVKAEAYDGLETGHWGFFLNLNFRFFLTGLYPAPTAGGEGT